MYKKIPTNGAGFADGFFLVSARMLVVVVAVMLASIVGILLLLSTRVLVVVVVMLATLFSILSILCLIGTRMLVVVVAVVPAHIVDGCYGGVSTIFGMHDTLHLPASVATLGTAAATSATALVALLSGVGLAAETTARAQRTKAVS